jgi:hypothetical protein
MSYEVEAIDTSAVPATAASQPTMREERVLNPYQTREQRVTIGQTDKVESQAPVESRTAEETVRLSPGAAALARRELKFRQQQQSLEKDRASLAAERAEIAQLRSMKEKLAAKDYSGFDELVDYNDYSQYKLNKLQGADPRSEELSQLRGKIESLEKMTEKNIETQFEAAVSERRTATAELVDKSGQFPRIKKAGANEAVVQHILDTWEHDSKELTVEQAAKEVESILVEKAKQWASLLEDEKPAVAEDPRKTLPPLKQGLKTLTNQVTASATTRPQKSYSQMSDNERYEVARQRALEKLQNR